MKTTEQSSVTSADKQLQTEIELQHFAIAQSQKALNKLAGMSIHNIVTIGLTIK